MPSENTSAWLSIWISSGDGGNIQKQMSRKTARDFLCWIGTIPIQI